VHSCAAFRGALTARLRERVCASGEAQEEFEQPYGRGEDYQRQEEKVDWPQHKTAAGAAA
jgi:hypothetical protein